MTSNSNVFITLILGLLSFAFVAIACLVDFFDHNKGNSHRKAIYIVSMIYSASLLFQVACMENPSYLWFIITVLMFSEKVAHKRSNERLMDTKVDGLKKVMRIAHVK